MCSYSEHGIPIDHDLIDSVYIEVISIIAVVVTTLITVISVVVLFSIAVSVVRLISLSILVSPGNIAVSHQPSQGNDNIDEVVDKTTTWEGRVEMPGIERK